MMLLSMTGFASTTFHIPIKGEDVTITLTLKSLNSRFFEANCKMPHALSHLENALTKKFKRELHRGTVYCTIYLSSLAPLSGAVYPSLKTVEEYLKSIKKIRTTFSDKYKLEGEISLKDLMQLPHVFELPEEPIDRSTAQILLHHIDLLIDDLIKERIKEGAALRKDLESRIKMMKTHVTKLEKRTKIAVQERKKRLLENAQTFLETASDEAKEHQLQQIHNQLEKMDVHEELVRFKTHIKNFQSSIESKQQEKGKKLDFILQELFREINTIAAKCSDSELSSLAISIKVELEKSREQAQNIV